MTLAKTNYKNVNDLFEDLFNYPTSWKGFNVPAVNIHETNDAYHLELSAPGVNKDDFKVNLDKGLLTISYEKKNVQENNEYKTRRREFSVSSFKRSFTVDENINADGIEAKYDNGILQLLLPKKDEVKVTPKQITIQ